MCEHDVKEEWILLVAGAEVATVYSCRMVFLALWRSHHYKVGRWLYPSYHRAVQFVYLLTIGSISIHLFVSWVFIDDFNCRWNRSMISSEIGWYAVVWIFCVPNNFENSANIADHIWEPWSIVITVGISKSGYPLLGYCTVDGFCLHIRYGYGFWPSAESINHRQKIYEIVRWRQQTRNVLHRFGENVHQEERACQDML